jgi:hypothetical protein
MKYNNIIDLIISLNPPLVFTIIIVQVINKLSPTNDWVHITIAKGNFNLYFFVFVVFHSLNADSII